MKQENSLWSRIRHADNAGIVAIMIIYFALIGILTKGAFFGAKNLTDMIRSVSVTGIMACATTLVMITANIDLSLGWMVGLAACITGVHSDNFAAALGLSVLACAACGALNGFLVGGLKLNAFITTLGTMYVFKGITMAYANNKLLTAPHQSQALVNLGQYRIGGLIPVAVVVFLVVAVIFGFILRRTNFGSRIYAVGANPTASRFSGISARKVIFLTYLLGGIATGIAGCIFYAKVMSTQAYSGVGLEFDVLTGIVLGGTSVTGGKGTVLGTALGIIFVGALTTGFNLLGINSNLQYVAQGLILLIAVGLDVKKSGGFKK